MPIVVPTSSPAPNRADSITVSDKQGARLTEEAKLTPSPVDPADFPARTGVSVGVSPTPSFAIAPPDPAKPESPPFVPIPAPMKESDPPVKPKVPQLVASADSAVGAKEPLADPLAPLPDVHDLPHDDSQTPSADPKASVQTSSDDIQPQSQGLGAIIYNAFGRAGPQNGGVVNGVNTISVPTAGVQEVSIGGG